MCISGGSNLCGTGNSCLIQNGSRRLPFALRSVIHIRYSATLLPVRCEAQFMEARNPVHLERPQRVAPFCAAPCAIDPHVTAVPVTARNR